MPRAPRPFRPARTGPPCAETAPEAPLHSDWAWRAPLWRSGATLAGDEVGNGAILLPGTRLFLEDETARARIRRGDEPGGASTPVALDLGNDPGSFLSLAVDLPAEGTDGLGRNHILRVETCIDAPAAGEVFLRLNLRHGPNSERLNRGFPSVGPQIAEFDLYKSGLDGTRVDAGWIDLIVVRPAPGRIVMGDLVLSRRLRAEV